MFRWFIELFNNYGNILSTELDRKRTVNIAALTIGFVLVLEASLIGTGRFSPDSWTVFELSKTIFSNHFYEFNTLRSYFSSVHSASFPFGLPILLAAFQKIGFHSPMVAVGINIFASIITIYFIFWICKKHNIAGILAFALLLSLLLNPYYLDEVLSGRTIPLSILLFIVAYWFSLYDKLFTVGIFLSLSALVRFDFLVYAVVFQLIAVVYKSHTKRQLALMLLGFTIGLLPWVSYSFLNFGKLWISDNSWVVISSVPVYVLDYPATSSATLFNEPLVWLGKIRKNILPTISAVLITSLAFPVLLVFIRHVSSLWKNIKQGRQKIFGLAIVFLAILPNIASGYHDRRYFILILFVASFVLIKHVWETKKISVSIKLDGLAFLSIILSALIGTSVLLMYGIDSKMKNENIRIEMDQIRKIYTCHKTHPEETYIFIKDANFIAPKYGAITGMKTAFIPSNFDDMNGKEREMYFSKMVPYKLIENLSNLSDCQSLQ